MTRPWWFVPADIQKPRARIMPWAASRGSAVVTDVGGRSLQSEAGVAVGRRASRTAIRRQLQSVPGDGGTVPGTTDAGPTGPRPPSLQGSPRRATVGALAWLGFTRPYRAASRSTCKTPASHGGANPPHPVCPARGQRPLRLPRRALRESLSFPRNLLWRKRSVRRDTALDPLKPPSTPGSRVAVQGTWGRGPSLGLVCRGMATRLLCSSGVISGLLSSSMVPSRASSFVGEVTGSHLPPLPSPVPYACVHALWNSDETCSFLGHERRGGGGRARHPRFEIK